MIRLRLYRLFYHVIDICKHTLLARGFVRNSDQHATRTQLAHKLYADDNSYWEVINSLCIPYVTHTQPIGQLAYKLTHLFLRLRLVRIHTLYYYTQLICNSICYGVRAP